MNNFQAHILVVDDDEGIRNLVKQYLNNNNFLVTTAQSAEDAEKKQQRIDGSKSKQEKMLLQIDGLHAVKAIQESDDEETLKMFAWYLRWLLRS